MADEAPEQVNLPVGGMAPVAIIQSPLDQVRGRLAPFLAANPASKIEEIEAPEKSIAVRYPWGDDSLNLRVAPENSALIDALNNVFLPERFLAIWHRDTKDLEIIFTALPLPPPFTELHTRVFTFRFEDSDYKCEYARASDRLLAIAEGYVPASAPVSLFRNLPSFRGYVLSQRGIAGFPKYDKAFPICFWIRGLEWDEQKVLALVTHMNFYMTYYDALSPTINVVAPKQETLTQKQRSQYGYGPFPKNIIATEIDDNLLHYWDAARTGDPFRRFLYNFNIIEYVSFYYIEENIRKSIRRILLSPNFADEIDGLSLKIFELISATKIQDAAKMEAVIKGSASPDLIWNEIHRNIHFFSAKTEFDGGFEMEPIVKRDWEADDFKVNWIPALPNALRGIRNALSHGKELKTRAIIAPTPGNFAKVQMWLPLISTIAGDVMVYRSAI